MPDFTVVEGGGPEGRDQILAEQDFKNALRAVAANMLRIIRGAGKPYELLIQLSDVISAAVKVREVTGQLPTDVMVNVLQGESKTEAIWERYAKGEIDKTAIDRWQEDGTIDRKYAEESIKAGALQVIASQFVDPSLQKAGQSELRDGINQAIAAREKSKSTLLDGHCEQSYLMRCKRGICVKLGPLIRKTALARKRQLPRSGQRGPGGRSQGRCLEVLRCTRSYVLINTVPVREKKGAQAIGRSRGGLTTKIHALVDALGNPCNLMLI
jgi:hypothetical protein